MYLVILALHFKNELNFCIEYCTRFSHEEYIVCNVSLSTREHYCFEILCISTAIHRISRWAFVWKQTSSSVGSWVC